MLSGFRSEGRELGLDLGLNFFWMNNQEFH